ncbi:MAG: dethiobiotin synthase, partial [Solirubrobacterales bacterium]
MATGIARGIFVTGTGTEVGKSIVAAAICAALAADGVRVAAFKPAVSGLEEQPGEWPPDHVLLAESAGSGQSPERVAPYLFGPPLSPHLAAELEGIAIEPERLRDEAALAAADADVLVVEGVGGLLVPLTPAYLVRDLAVDLGLPVVVVAAPGLGTINHTLLTIESSRAAGLTVAGAVLTPWPDAPGALERSNRETISHLGKGEVSTLPVSSSDGLAQAARHLPIER